MSTFKAIQELLEGARGARNAIDDIDPQALQTAARNLVQRRRGREQLTTPVPTTPSTTPATPVATEKSGAQQQQLQQRQEVLDPEVLKHINRRPGKYVYHGTSAAEPFEEFDLNYLSKGEGAQVYGIGTYLGATPNISKHYATSKVPSGPPKLFYNVTVRGKEYRVFRASDVIGSQFRIESVDRGSDDDFFADSAISVLFQHSEIVGKNPEEVVKSVSSEEGIRNYIVEQFRDRYTRMYSVAIDINKMAAERDKFLSTRSSSLKEEFFAKRKAKTVLEVSDAIRDYWSSVKDGTIDPRDLAAKEKTLKESFKEALIRNKEPITAMFNFIKDEKEFYDHMIGQIYREMKGGFGPSALDSETYLQLAHSAIREFWRPIKLISHLSSEVEIFQSVKNFIKAPEVVDEVEPYEGFARVTIPSAPISNMPFSNNIWIHWQEPVPRDIVDRFLDDFEVSEKYLDIKNKATAEWKTGQQFYGDLAELARTHPDFEKLLLKRIRDVGQDPETIRRTEDSLNRLSLQKEKDAYRYSEALVSEYLTRIGVTGITYKGRTHDRENFVIFDPRVARRIEWMSHDRAEREAKQGTPPKR